MQQQDKENVSRHSVLSYLMIFATKKEEKQNINPNRHIISTTFFVVVRMHHKVQNVIL